MYNASLYIVTVLIWGSTWIAINYQYGVVSESVSLVYRFGLASGVLFIYCLIRGLPLGFSLRAHARFALLALCLFAFNYYFLYLGQKHINSALAAIAFSTILILNIFNGAWIFKNAITGKIIAGAALGLTGIVTLFWPELQKTAFADVTMVGIGLCLLGTVFASFGNMTSIANQQEKLPIVQSNAWAMGYGALIMAIVTLLRGEPFVMDWRPQYLISLLYLAVFGSVIAFGCYLSLLTRIGAQKTSYATILFPAVAVVISTFVEGFEWNGYVYTGMLLIVLGNITILYPAKVQKNLREPEQESPILKSEPDELPLRA
ncbi:MAG: DMT family transporter [Aestuariibacter sp.]